MVAPSLTPPRPLAPVFLPGPPESRPGHLGPRAQLRGCLVPPPQPASEGSPPAHLRTTGPAGVRRSAPQKVLPLSHTPAESPWGLASNLAVTSASNQSVELQVHSHHVPSFLTSVTVTTGLATTCHHPMFPCSSVSSLSNCGQPEPELP